MTLGQGGFGGPGGPGGPRGPGGPGGPGGFGPGMFLGPAFMDALDSDKNGTVSQAEFREGFARWFAAWTDGGKEPMTEDQLRAGINKDLSPFRGGPPGGFPGGPPEDMDSDPPGNDF